MRTVITGNKQNAHAAVDQAAVAQRKTRRARRPLIFMFSDALVLHVGVKRFTSLYFCQSKQSQGLNHFIWPVAKPLFSYTTDRKENLHVGRYCVGETNFLDRLQVTAFTPGGQVTKSFKWSSVASGTHWEAAHFNPLSAGSRLAVYLANFQVFAFTPDRLHFCLRGPQAGGVVIVTTRPNK